MNTTESLTTQMRNMPLSRGQENVKSLQKDKFRNGETCSESGTIISSSPTDTAPRNQPCRLDDFLKLYCKWSSSATLQERGIKLLQWSFWLISRITQDREQFPKELSPSLRKVYSDLSIMRYFLRLYGMPLALEAIRSGSWAGGEWKDGKIRKLTSFMAWSMLIYHPLEHVALAQWTMPKLFPTLDGNRLSAWSCRFWMMFIGADFVSALLKNRELREKKKFLLSSLSKKEDDNNRAEYSSATTVEVESLEKSIFLNKIQMLRCALFTPPCVNWSMPKLTEDPLFSENVVNGFSFAEAVTCIYQSLLSLR